MLFNEPKLLKFAYAAYLSEPAGVSVLFNEPKLLKCRVSGGTLVRGRVSVLFNEPKLLKYGGHIQHTYRRTCFSALQRAEIAEIIKV